MTAVLGIAARNTGSGGLGETWTVKEIVTMIRARKSGVGGMI